jgi:hypothetical protein
MKRTPLRRCSKKHAKELATYSVLRQAYLSEHPKCHLCSSFATDIHHTAKRGKNLNNVSTWLGLCRACHTQIENNKTWARAEGYLK